MHEPGLAVLARRRETAREAHLVGIGIAAVYRFEVEPGGAALELARQAVRGSAKVARVIRAGRRVAPLHDVVVLRAPDSETVEIPIADEFAQVDDVRRRKVGGEFEYDTTVRQFQVHHVRRQGPAPVVSGRSFEHARHGRPFLAIRCRRHEYRGQRGQQQCRAAHECYSVMPSARAATRIGGMTKRIMKRQKRKEQAVT